MAVINIWSFFFYMKYATISSFNDYGIFNALDPFFRLIFIFDILANFVIEREVVNQETQSKEVFRSVDKIALIYLKGPFWMDLLTVIPIEQLLKSKVPYPEYFMVVKVIRLKNQSKILTSKQIIKMFKGISNYLNRRHQDQNKVSKTKNYTFIV